MKKQSVIRGSQGKEIFHHKEKKGRGNKKKKIKTVRGGGGGGGGGIFCIKNALKHAYQAGEEEGKCVREGCWLQGDFGGGGR